MKTTLFFGLIAFILALHFGKLLVDSGFFKTIKDHDFDCHNIADIPGSEDMALTQDQSKLFVSSDDRRPGSIISGGIWLVDPGQDSVAQVSPPLPFEFHPHGISIFENSQGLRLWAINHRQDRTSVEVFDWQNGSLKWIQTIDDPLFQSANDLAAIDRRQFYISSDHGSAAKLLQTMEAYCRLGFAYLSFYDGNQAHIVDRRISFANGLLISPDQRTLYLAATLERRVRVYAVDPTDHSVRLTNTIFVDSGPDNITFDGHGDLWIGAHPQVMKLKSHMQSWDKDSPAQILRIQAPLSAHPIVQEVMLQKGDRASAISVAQPVKDQVYLGTIFRSQLLKCKIP